MQVAVDIGGTKTLLATFDSDGKIEDSIKFPTDHDYPSFLEQLAQAAAQLTGNKKVTQVAVAAPGRIDREHGIAISFGNLPWEDVPIAADMQKIFDCPVLVENDANLAGLSEARALPNSPDKVLYITISTGIGTGIITDGIIDPDFADSESGQMPIERDGKLQTWESFASGSAIVERYGKRAADIDDEATWREIVPDFAIGILNLIATIQPDVVVIGGGVGSHFDRFGKLLIQELDRFATDLVPVPPVQAAVHPEEAVIYGCYELLKDAANEPAAR